MGAIPQPIYERIKEAQEKKEPAVLTLVFPGDGTIKEGILTPAEIIPAK